MTRSLLLLCAIAALWPLACPAGENPADSDQSQHVVLEASGGRQWRRGNMHTHSLWSDGDDYLEMIALWYRDHGYQFLVFTDHNVLANTERWIDVEKSKGGKLAFEKLEARFPDAAAQRTTPDGTLEARLSTFAEVSRRFDEPEEFLLVQGEEISDLYDKYPIHLNVSNVQEVLSPTGGGSVLETMQANVRAAHQRRQQTGEPQLIHLNHPNFYYAVTAEDLAQVVGENFFEVYNGHPSVANSGDEHHVSVERMWDIVLTLRLAQLRLPLMYGLATDDGHEYHHMPSRAAEPGRGWVMVLTDELSIAALVKSMEAGRFYSSSGVDLRRIETTDDGYTVEVEPAPGEEYVVEFIGTRWGYDAASEPVVVERPKKSAENQEGDASDGVEAEGDDVEMETVEMYATRRYSQEVGEVLQRVAGTRATYTYQGNEIYVRARVTSSALHPNPSEVDDRKQAWTQPVTVERR